ncbi:hypothetical protein BDA99DRAFT_498454 [Phascolomyces articulosus]|uniref:UspA domain-containing protein n=1 Tax=Phascolomyces articulosus TaxID=60185 RepID=A0AAD5K903_9FUNG|nr:hypothetical protein BDA99DRAFT_498454 [Phascolomyces articulosus]
MPSSFRIVVAADDTLASHHAVAFAIDLCSKIAESELQVIHAVGLNPPGTSLLGSLDRTSNLEIQKDAQTTARSLRQVLPEGTEVILKESYEPVQNIISEFVNENPPNMLVIGSSNRTGLER